MASPWYVVQLEPAPGTRLFAGTVVEVDAVVGVVLGLVVVDEFGADTCGVDPHPAMTMTVSPLTSSGPRRRFVCAVGRR
jgi:hypothetical protein